ncbi:MAG: PCRF domain-containing protein, partial [Myxococcales bacterium]
MFHKLEEIELKFERLTHDLADPAVMGNAAKLQKVAKERASLEPLIESYRRFKQLRQQLKETEEMLEDPEMRDLAKDELPRLRGEVERLESELKILLLPKDPNDERNVMLEIRAGTGGDEASLFAGELMRMYLRYAER